MKRQTTKQVLVSLLGICMCKITFAGCYPLIVAYFAAGCLEGSGRILLTVMMLFGMAVLLPITAMAKYAMAILVTLVMIKLVEWANKGCFTWVGALVAGASTALLGVFGGLMNLKDQTSVIVGVLEGVFILGATMVISRILHIFMEWRLDEREEIVAEDDQGERLLTYAQSFQGLSNVFLKMNMRQGDFSPEEMGQIHNELTAKLCATCDSCAICWDTPNSPMYGYLSQLIESVRKAGKADRDAELKMEKYCPFTGSMVEEAVHVFERARLNQSWYNRLLENREVIAEQLDAMAYIMEDCARPDKDISREKRGMLTELKYRARERGISLEEGKLFENANSRWRLKITVKAKSGCIPVREMTKAVSLALSRPMMPHKDTKAIIGKDEILLIYEEETQYESVRGVARLVKDGAAISGDNFSFLDRDTGQMIISLSDGMGSGNRACRESEMVVELLEKFLEAGFGVETAIRMMNSAMVMKGENDLFSTVDISVLNLYDGNCDIYKIGASATFIKHEEEVECLLSTSLPAGVYHHLEIEHMKKQLGNGDFLVMVTDGVLEYLHVPHPEETMQEIVESIQTNNPNTLAKKILERVLLFTGGKVADDMTVLVSAVWEK